MKIIVAAVSGAHFNHTLHYRYTDIGEVLGFLAQKRPDDVIEFYDSLAYEIESNLLRTIASGIDIVIFFVDVASAAATLKIATIIRIIDPDIHILAYGKATLRIPQYFTRPPFNAVYISGDQEAAILSYLQYREEGTVPKGVWCAHSASGNPGGVRLHPEEWGYPMLSKLPLPHYRRIARAKDIPFELSVYPSKGCPDRCYYCDASWHEGVQDRRRNPVELLEWTAWAVQTFGFDCVQMHSTNFCAIPEWVELFCRSYRSAQAHFKWTCCTHPATLTRDLVRNMADAGCLRIGIGIENMRDASSAGPKASLQHMQRIAQWIDEAGIACKAYIMAGMPGQTERDLLYTYLKVLALKWIPRVSTYTPFHELTHLSVETLDQMDLSLYDRKSFLGHTDIPPATMLKLAIRFPGAETWAHKRYEQLLNDKGKP